VLRFLGVPGEVGPGRQRDWSADSKECGIQSSTTIGGFLSSFFGPPTTAALTKEVDFAVWHPSPRKSHFNRAQRTRAAIQATVSQPDYPIMTSPGLF
jgi:hypothetical protein